MFFLTSLRYILLVLLCALVAGGVWFGHQAYSVYSGVQTMTGRTLPRIHGLEPIIKIPPLDSNQRINFLILGSDNDRKKEEARPLTQSMIVVTVDPKHHKVGMLSLPRDFYVPIHGHGWAKIDLASKYGGIRLARQTVEHLFHIPIDYYAWVGLGGFIKVIDAFGGVNIDVQHPILDDRYPRDITSTDPYGYQRLFIPAGWQHMSGTSALEYVRSRHGDLIGDFGRSARQQQVLLRLHQKINTMSILTRLPQLMDDLQNSVRTDLSLWQLYQLEKLSHAIHRQDVTRVVLSAPTYCQYAWTADGQSILRPNWAKIMPVVHRLFAPIQASSPPQRKSTRESESRHLPSKRSRPQSKSPPPPPAPHPAPPPAAPPEPAQLPGRLLFVQSGNLFELRRNKSIRQLTYQGDAAMPSPAPNGRTVAFVRFTKGLERYGKYASDIWLLDVPTQRQHVITHDENAITSNNLWAAWPTWSADGRHLVFSWDASKLSTPPSDIRPTDLALWSMTARGTHRVQLTTPPRGAGGDTSPAGRPGRHQIVYVSWGYLPSNQPYSQLDVVNTVTHAVSPLTPATGRVLQPSWSRNGRSITFVRTVNGKDQVVVAEVTSTPRGLRLDTPTVITAGEVAQPALSPNGKWVSYLQSTPAGFALYLAPVGGGQAIRIGEAGSSIDARSRPVWMP